MSNFKKIFFTILLCILFVNQSVSLQTASASSSDPFPFIILSQYEATVDIGEDIYILAITSNGNKATWKSSKSSIASVNTYGIVTAKKAGSVVITAKIKNAEASCYITVNKTDIKIKSESIALERGETYKLTAATSNGSAITWKSSKKSIATVDKFGTITGIKPGQTTITANADGTSATCTVTVKAPTVTLNRTSANLFRGNTIKLSATVSSKVNPTWKTSKKSVAIVDTSGNVTAVKNGTATITATVDGVSAVCEVTVSKPEITLSADELTLKKGENATLTATVSSGNQPTWSTSNSNVISVNSKGEMKALKKGKAYVYAAEDGTKVRCMVTVTE